MKNRRIVISLVWAFAIIASAFVLRGHPASLWVETALTGMGVTFAVLKSPDPACLRKSR